MEAGGRWEEAEAEVGRGRIVVGMGWAFLVMRVEWDGGTLARRDAGGGALRVVLEEVVGGGFDFASGWRLSALALTRTEPAEEEVVPVRADEGGAAAAGFEA